MDYTFIYYHRIHFPSASGQTIQVLRDYHALSGTLGTVHIFYRSPVPHRNAEINDSLKDYGSKLTPHFQMHCIIDGWFGKSRTEKEVIRLIQSSEKPVIIVTRTLYHAEKAISIRDKFRSGPPIKVILELHETAIPHIVYHEQKRNIKAFFSLRKEKKIFCETDGILCTAPPQLTILDRRFPDHAPAVVLPNAFSPSAAGLDLKRGNILRAGKKSFHIRYAGQFSLWKNTDVIIEAMKFLPDTVLLDIAGGKPEDEEGTEKMLMEKSQICGVENRVKYFGFLAPTRVPLFLAEADCLVLPLGNNVQSRLFTSPIKLFEYAASRVPMIVTRQPTTSSLLEEGVHALMVEPDSPQELAEAVRAVSMDKKMAQKLADKAKEWVAQYAPHRHTENYKNFLSAIIGH